MKYHNEYEIREREYRMNFFKKKKNSFSLKKIDYDTNVTITGFEHENNGHSVKQVSKFLIACD